jgi:hypothetical protein
MIIYCNQESIMTSNLKQRRIFIFTYDSWSISRPKKVATSPAFHRRWIGHANGSDQPSNKHFAKRSFHLAKIKPPVHGFYRWPLNFQKNLFPIHDFQKGSRTSQQSTRKPHPQIFTNKPLNFQENMHAVQNFVKDFKLHNNPPESARTLRKTSDLPQISKTLKIY